MTVRVRVRQVAADQRYLSLTCVGTLTKCTHTAGGRSRRGSLKAGTTVCTVQRDQCTVTSRLPDPTVVLRGN